MPTTPNLAIPYPASTDEIADGAQNMQAIATNLDTLLGGAWTSYTPTWTASTTNPTLGNGTLTGFYKKVGRTVVWRLRLTLGSTTNIGSGAWRWSLPVNAVAVFANAGEVLGTASLYRASPVTRNIRTAYTFSNAIATLIADDGTAVGAAAPWGWLAGDALSIVGMYESAS